MPRYIDTDEFEKRIKPYDTDDSVDKAMYNFAHNKMMCTPTADVVEVVRCEKCKWQRKRLLDNGHYWYECGYGNESLGHDGEFCSDGERKKMLTLPIKEPWFSMIRSGEKKEEYREIKDYYRTRFANQFPSIEKKSLLDEWLQTPIRYEFDVLFRNGYSSKSQSFVAHCRLRVGTGKPEWGAEEGKRYYILEILSTHTNEERNERFDKRSNVYETSEVKQRSNEWFGKRKEGQ